MIRLVKWLISLISPHSWEHYATEGPYEPDGHYWEYYRCRWCGENTIGSKRTVEQHGEPDQPWT